MQDPRGWWQGRLEKSNPQGESRLRSPSSGVRPFAAEAITNPIFFIPPTYGSGGSGGRNIAVGDFNGDGKPDLLVSNQCISDADCTQSTIAVLLGNGDGTFQIAAVSNTGAVVSSVTTGDFNRDGKLDVAVDNECADPGCASGSINILLGKGDGTFQPPVTYAAGGNSFSVEAGDVNGDGKLDLIGVNGLGSVGVLLGNGDGTFQPVSTFSTLPGNSAVFLGDFNGDNKLDLAVVNGSCDAAPACTTSVGVLLGNGDGTFRPPLANQSIAGVNPQAVALGDVNGDGKLDLGVVVDCVPQADTCVNESVEVFLGKGDGMLKAAKSSGLGSSDVTFAGFGELNEDGKADLVVVDDQAATAAVMPGAGDGTFHLEGIYKTEGLDPLFGVFGDFNGDGKTDFAAANLEASAQGARTGTVIAWLGTGDEAFSGPIAVASGGVLPISAEDLNHDGRPDLVVARQVCDAAFSCITGVDVLLSKPDGSFQPAVTYSTGGTTPVAIAEGDFNHDSKPDLVVISRCASQQDCTHGVIGVLLGNGNGTFQSPINQTSGAQVPASVVVGDFNADGKLDLAIAHCSDLVGSCLVSSNGTVSVLLGNGDGTFGAALNYSSGDPSPQAVVTGDFDGDGKLDLAVANGNCTTIIDVTCGTGSVGVLLGNGDGTFRAVVTYSSVDDDSFALTAGDFNGDGKLDLAVGNTACEFVRECPVGSIAVLLGNGDGTLQAATIYPPGDPWVNFEGPPGPTSIVASDLNGDGKVDLAVSNRNVLLGNGDGTFQAAQSYNPGAGKSSTSVLVADFNRDGKPDLAVSDSAVSLGGITLLLNISSGFQQATSTSLTSSRNPAGVHRHVTFTATVTSTSQGEPTGTVTFSDKGHALATESIADGKAKFRTASLEAGVHSITASYSGDETFRSSTSSELDQIIRAETRTELSSSHNPSRRGQPVTFTARVAPDSGGTPTGKITFRDFHSVLATVELSGAQAVFSTSRLRRGHHVIRADYGGSPTDGRSFATVAQRVK
jgi:hypothetical protein